MSGACAASVQLPLLAPLIPYVLTGFFERTSYVAQHALRKYIAFATDAGFRVMSPTRTDS
eukprot:scaffold313925_cov37-Tisochrysis_lutea.AAC.1